MKITIRIENGKHKNAVELSYEDTTNLNTELMLVDDTLHSGQINSSRLLNAISELIKQAIDASKGVK